MRRLAIMAAIILLTAGSAPASRLCRDTKGLFTPCTGERPISEHHRRQRDAAPAAPGSATAEPRADRPGPAVRQAAARPTKPPLIAKTRLCRDSKGLFTPCVR